MKVQGRVGTLEGAVRKMVYCNVTVLRQSLNLRSTALASAQICCASWLKCGAVHLVTEVDVKTLVLLISLTQSGSICSGSSDSLSSKRGARLDRAAQPLWEHCPSTSACPWRLS